MIAVLYFASIFIAFVYIFIITHILTTWNEIEEWETSDSYKPDTTISVIIPFRKEAGNIADCVKSILSSNYPKSKFEIIAVDDHSDDNGAEALGQFLNANVRLLSLENVTGKKAAISRGVEEASGKLIVTVDADCVVQAEWLRQISSFYSYTGKTMIVGMVALEGNENILEYFQIMDTCGVMGLHGAGIHNNTHYLANGANFIFEKALFDEINPFQDDLYASGDDVHFVNKVAARSPDTIGFLKCRRAIVETKVEKSWAALLKQRKRWASKNSSFSKGSYKWMTGAIWLLSLSIIVNILLIPFTNSLSLFVALTQLLIKGIMDFLYLQNMTRYFEKTKVLKFFIPAFFIQTIYIFVMGVLALSGGSHEWKGRIQK